MKGLLAALLLLAGLPAAAQEVDTAGTSPPKRVRAGYRPIFNFDTRRTHVDGENAKFNGFRIGAQRGKDIIAVGFYGLATPFIEEDVLLADVPDTTSSRLKIDYVGLTYERIVFDSRKWQISIPVQLGLGSVSMDYLDSTEVYRPYARQEVVPVESGVKGAFKLLFWLHLTAGVGYRHVFTRDRLAGATYSNLTWNYGISIKLGEIVRYASRKIKEKNDGQEGG